MISRGTWIATASTFGGALVVLFVRKSIKGYGSFNIIEMSMLAGFFSAVVFVYGITGGSLFREYEREKPLAHETGFKTGGWENDFGLGGSLIAFLIAVFSFQPVGSIAARMMGISFIVAGITGIIFGLAKLHRRRMVENIPTSKIRSAAVGLVELQGKAAKHSKEYTSPILKKKCVHYSTIVQNTRKRGVSERECVFSESSSQTIVVEDETGSIPVHLPGANFELDQDFYTEARGTDDEKLLAFCKEKGISGITRHLSSGLRYEEIVIEKGDPLYVMGTAKIGKDGKLFIGKGEEERFFVISEYGRRGLVEQFTTQIFGGLVGGSIALLSGILMVLSSFA